MRISYRQGLVSAQTNFLQIGQNDSRYVDVIVSPTPVIAAIAQRDRDYLIDETISVNNAWGPFSDTQTYYLYWELFPNGDIARGATTLSPMTSSNPPAEQTGQMWFDTAEKVMKVFDGIRWVPSLRVLAGTLHSGGILVSSNFGSQVGLNEPTDAGYILRDAFGNCFRDNNGNLLTSAHPLTSSDTGSLVKFDGTQLSAQANENIPRFSLVYLIDGRAALASGIPPENIPKAPLGIVTEDAYQNTVVTIVTAGKTVFNEQWNFAISDLGKPVWCGPHGEVALNKPLAQKNMRVGTIITKQSILLNFDWETEASTVTSGVTGIMASAPLNITGTLSSPIINIPRATSNTDGFMNASDFARIPALENDLALKSDIGHLHSISDVQTLGTALAGKADNIHTQDIASITDLSTTLAGKSNTGHTHTLSNIDDWANTYLTINSSIAGKIPKTNQLVADVNNFPFIVAGGTLIDSGFNDMSFALAGHTHVTSDVTGLSGALALKSDTNHEHIIGEVSGLQTELNGKALTIHSHATSDITNLDTILSGKAASSHLHTISNVTGLQDAIDGKAAASHAHIITDTTGLQTALNGKADTIHAHTISNVTGLDLALGSKADVSHTHTAANITDFSTASFNKIASTLQAGTNITLTPNVGAETITIASSGGGGGGTTMLSHMMVMDGNSPFNVPVFMFNVDANQPSSTPTPFVVYDSYFSRFLITVPSLKFFKITISGRVNPVDPYYGNDMHWPTGDSTRFGSQILSPAWMSFYGPTQTHHMRYDVPDYMPFEWSPTPRFSSFTDVYYAKCETGVENSFGLEFLTELANFGAYNFVAAYNFVISFEEMPIQGLSSNMV